jgi:hypothetical protein
MQRTGGASVRRSPGHGGSPTERWATLRRALLLIATLVAATAPLLAAAQPGAADVTLVASGLAYPRGVTWDGNGQMSVAGEGDGPVSNAADASSGTTPVEHAFGLFYAGFIGAVVKIDKGCSVPVATGLPSEQQSSGWHQGVASLAFLGGTLYASVDGGGSARGNPINPSGVYMVGMGGCRQSRRLDAGASGQRGAR